MYNPKVSNPSLKNSIPQMKSNQTPFFFGGSQVPDALFLPKSIYNGSKGGGICRTSSSNINSNKIVLPENKY
jgi:hypothetical protein